MKRFIKIAAGIVTGMAGTQAFLFWLAADISNIPLALAWIALSSASMWCFSGEKETETI